MAPEKIERATMVDEVVDRLRSLIYSGDIKPGERLLMRDLQDRFGVSHIPIREALRTLEAEGLVENLPQRGAVATEGSLSLLEEVYDARRLLEPAIAARAAVRFTDDDLAGLKEAVDELQAAHTSTDGSFSAPHRRFHWLTLRPGATPTLEKMLRQLWGMADRFLALSLAFPADVEKALRQHAEIYRLCAERDPAVAEIIADHLHVTEDALRAHYGGDPPASAT